MKSHKSITIKFIYAISCTATEGRCDENYVELPSKHNKNGLRKILSVNQV